MPNDKKYCFYESPNIVIVPTVSFLNGPPEKKIKLDSDSKTATTTSNIKTLKNNNSRASNYLQSIGQSPAQLATSSKSKIPIVCYPDRGDFEVNQENQEKAIKSYCTEKRKSELKTVFITDINNFPERKESIGTKENIITVIQHNPPKPTTQLDSNLGSNKKHSLLKKCDSDIQDKQSLVVKNQIKEADNKKLTSKLPEPKKPIVPPSKIYNEKNGKNQMQKQKKIHDTPCFKSKLNNKNDNCYKVNKVTEKHINRRNGNQNLGNEVNYINYNKTKFKASREFSTPGAQEVTKKLSGKEKSSGIKSQDINEIDNRVKSLLSSILPVKKKEEAAEIQLNLLKSKSKTKNKITNIKVQTSENISDSFTLAENVNHGDKIENVIIPYESGKGKNSGSQTYLVMNTLKKKSLTKACTVTQSSKYKCETQKYISKFNKNCKVENNAPLVKVHNKHKQIKHTSQEVGHIKEKCNENRKCSAPATEVTNPTCADHNNTVPNDVTFDGDNKVKQELPIQNKSSKPKVTTIKLVINLISGKTKEKSIVEEPKSTESCELANLDLSFLDDFNVDDIVDSLNYDVNICKHIEVETKNGGTCEACGPNSLNENGHVMDIIPGSICEENEPVKTQHNHEIGIKTERVQLEAAAAEESMTEMVITSNKQLTCNTSRKKDFNTYKESRISDKNVTMIDKSNLLEPSGKTIMTKQKKINSTGKNHISTEENIKDTSSQSNFKELAEQVRQTGVNMPPQNANTTHNKSVDSLSNICIDSFKKSSTDAMFIDLTEPEENTNLKRQHLNANITNKSSTDCLSIDLTKPEENTDLGQHLNSNIKNKCADVLFKLLLNTVVDASKTSDDKSNSAINLTKPEQKTVSNMLEVNNNITNNCSTDYNICIDLTEPERNNNPKVQQLNTNIKDNISADTSLDSFKPKTDTSKSSHNFSYIDLTEPEQNFCSNLQQQDTNIKGVRFADSLMKFSTSTKGTSKSSDNITPINSSEPDQNVVPIMQQFADLNNRISVENCISSDSLQTSMSNVELLKTMSINVATEHEIDPKIQNKCNERVDKECNSKMTKQNEQSKENTCSTKIRSEHINCQKLPKVVVSQVKTTQVKSLQVNSNKTDINDIHIDQPKATDETCVKDQGNPDIVKLSPQASKQLLEKVDTTTTAGLRKNPCEEILSRDLESRMLNYLGINYHIGALIRKGKFSKIFHCFGPNKNEYAIKILHEQQDRYELGIKKENMLIDMQKDIPKENQHFVYLINGFGIEGRWCFLMEYYPKNLRQVLNEKNECFHIDDVQKLSRQLVSAVIVLRHNNIVHSDIKPEHILLNNSLDRLKLCGFDECRSVDQVILLPNIGTSSYRAPELILGYSDGFSIDVWSTALVMFEMATGRKLFPGVFNNDILFKQMSVFGNIPLQMIHSSIFKNSHFCGHYTYTHFMRRTGYMGKEIELIGKFHRNGIASYIYNAYQKFFQNTATKKREDKVKDKQKLRLFCALLHQMFVMDPKQRIPIEFVYANPFIFEKFDRKDV